MKISRDLSNMHCKSCSPYVQLLKMEMFFYVRSSAAEDGDGDVYTSEVSEIVSVISSDQYKEMKFRHLKKICNTFEKD